MRLKDKVALVTGGSRGIGREICHAFAAEGAKVVVNYANHPTEAELVAAAIRERGGEAYAWGCDVSDETQVNAMVAEAGRVWGGVDILVNNAAVYPRKKWHQITVEEWDRVMAVNVRAFFLTAKAVYPYMSEKGRGKIINVSSVTFWSGQKDFLHYVSSKGAIVGFTRALARETGREGINVNCITPGAVETEQELLDIPDERDRQALAAYMAEVQCFTRREVPADVVGSFLFLASSDSDFITGQTLNVDGGWLMH